MKGYKWKFDNEEKDKVYNDQGINETLRWIENMQLHLKDLIPEDKIRLLFDKWVTIQNVCEITVSERRRIIQDEAILQAYELKKFKSKPKWALGLRFITGGCREAWMWANSESP
jgi:hypothetical protein